ELRIMLDPDQSGSVEIDISATDGGFRVGDSFTLTVSPVPDDPIANGDAYNVPVGARLQILNPDNGVLGNDSDADGETILVDLNSVVGPTLGTLDLNADGTFTYTNTSGEVNAQDSFSYRVVDDSGAFSDPVTVNLILGRSRYQNPLPGLAEDVDADGEISALDALRVINFLSRELIDSSATFVPVADIGTPPPDFYDTSGNGRVSAQDALLVINRLGQISAAASSQGEAPANLGVTTSFATANPAGLPARNVEAVGPVQQDPRDALLADGVEISQAAQPNVVELLPIDEEEKPASPSRVDEALSLLMDEVDSNGAGL
ncbi:MAG: Ig-like domain-containing protein, partial [Pirellulales bacterium]|nr:Ig-like domain-containing protein [Pirellulales bacterium]